MLSKPLSVKKFKHLAKVATAKELYSSGLSTRQVAERLGVSKSWVHRNVDGRDRTIAIIMAMNKEKQRSSHWRTARTHARRTWESCVGPISKGYHVHHKDGDYTNGCFSNLEILEAKEHMTIHRPRNPIPRHLRPERKEYMKQYWKKRKEAALAE